MALGCGLAELMIRLAVETSTMTQSVAVEVDGQVVATRAARRRAGHSASLLLSVEQALADVGREVRDIEEIVCGLGPGSFTGVRVGLSFALGVGAGIGAPVFGVESPRAFLGALPSSIPVAVALDARKQEVYGVVYAGSAERPPLVEANTFAPADFFAELDRLALPGLMLVGDGPRAFPEAWAEAPRGVDYLHRLDVPQAAGLFEAHARGWSYANDARALEPRYIRPSDAQLSKSAGASKNDV